MLNLALIIVEGLLLLWALVAAGRWVASPDGKFEPSIVLATLLIALIEFARRRLPDDATPTSQAAPRAAESLEPFLLGGIQLNNWRSDPVIGKSVVEAESAGASFAIPFVHEAPRKLAEGFDYFLTSDGRQCHYFGTPQSGEKFVLMFRLPAGSLGTSVE